MTKIDSKNLERTMLTIDQNRDLSIRCTSNVDIARAGSDAYRNSRK